MFIYWDGYEIDGSDTDFTLVLPENVQISEFVDCFLALPVFSRDERLIEWTESGQRHESSLSELHQMLLAGNYPDIDVSINCLLMEQMPDDLQQTLYGLSARRVPPENYSDVLNPCMAPVVQRGYTRGDMTVVLRIPKAGSRHASDNVCELNGYVNNIELLSSCEAGLPYFSINVGPGFYYEYAIYIIDSLRDSFPGLCTYGGLDCADGWTAGCTYCNSLYGFEKVQLPVEHNISHTLKRLTAYGIVSFARRSFYLGRLVDTSGIILVNSTGQENSAEPQTITFSEYLSLIDTAYLLTEDSFTLVCDTAVHMLLPSPAEFSQNPLVEARLQSLLPAIQEIGIDWWYSAYLAFTLADGKFVCEFRVPVEMRSYLLTLLELAESGEIEFMKQATYERRQ